MREIHDLIATAIRNACPNNDDCLEDEEECFRRHPVHASEYTSGVITHIDAELDGLVDIIIATLEAAGRLTYEPFTAAGPGEHQL